MNWDLKQLKTPPILEGLTYLEIAFSRNEYVQNILCEDSTKNKINASEDINVDLLMHTVIFVSMDKLAHAQQLEPDWLLIIVKLYMRK